MGGNNRNDTTMPLILIIGKDGQVGWELQRTFMPLGQIIAVGRSDMPLTDNNAIQRVIREIKPNLIINAAAYTAVDKAEQELNLAMQINGIAPGIIAEEAQRINASLIHFSTDYVFDGTNRAPYVEDDMPNPASVYGHTKLAGERAIQAIATNYLILRTAWVYAARGHNFLRTIYRLAREKEELHIVADQYGTPTWARWIAEATAHVVSQTYHREQHKNFDSGIYHLTATGNTNWHGFAEKIIEFAQHYMKQNPLSVKRITPITTAQYPTPAKRPMNSRLAINRLSERFNLMAPTWDSMLHLCMQEFIKA